MAKAKTNTSNGAKTKDVLASHGVTAKIALELMQEMLLYRRFEEKTEESYAIGKIGGFCHLHIGQEAGAAGVIKVLQPEDYAISAYRSHTQAIAKGISPKAVMAELYGRVGGVSGGKGGSMHVFGRDARFFGGHGIVGGQVPLATGIGWKIKYSGENLVCVCFMGDATVNQGGFHECLNMAAVWELPVIYVVENNEYGMGTSFDRVSKTKISTRAVPFDIPASSVNGQNVLSTFEHFRNLTEEVRAGGGPRLVELRTYRFRGHSMSDPVSGTYRSTEEVERHKEESDPIAILRDQLFAEGVLDQDTLEEMDATAKTIAAEAADFAEESPMPEPEALYENVWAETNAHGRLFFDGRRT